MTRFRNCCFTSYLLNESDIQLVESEYLVYGREVCPETKRNHLQGYLEFKEGKSLSSIKKLFKDNTLHIEKRKGTAQQAADYCKKDGDIFEKGVISKQGARGDLDDVVQRVLRGEISVDGLVEEAPTLVHQYGRTLDRAEDIRMRRVWRTEMTTCDWIVGKTEAGKSTYAFKEYNPETHYKWKYDSGWQDDYRQQPIVVINEFRGQIKYSDLLELIDKFPCEVRRRNRPPLPFTSKHIIITSALLPDELYHNLSANDSLAQLLRRINIKTLDKDYNLIPFIKK